MGCAASSLDGPPPSHTHTHGAAGVKPQTAAAANHTTQGKGAMSPQKPGGANTASGRKAATAASPVASARVLAARSPVQSRSALRLREARILHEKFSPADADGDGDEPANEKSQGVRFPRIAGRGRGATTHSSGTGGSGPHHHGHGARDSDEQLLQLREHERAQLEAAGEGEPQPGDSSPSKKSATARRGSRGSTHRLPHLSPTVGSGSGQTPRGINGGFFSATTRTHGLEDCGSDHSVAGMEGGVTSGLTSGFGVPSSSTQQHSDGSRRGSNFTATTSAKTNPAVFASFATSVAGENQQQQQHPQPLHRQPSKTNSKLSIEVRTPLQQHHDHATTTATTKASPVAIGSSTNASAFSKRTPESGTASTSHKKELVHMLPQCSPPAQAAPAADAAEQHHRDPSTDETGKKKLQLQVSIDSCDAAPSSAPSSHKAAATAAAAAAAAVAAATPQQSGNGDVIPIQDAASYALQYSMYSDSSPQYREYKAAWELEQARLKAERHALKGVSHLRSRSIYSPEPSDRSGAASPLLTGVVSPVPGAMSPTGEEGGFFVARGTALCLMFESSRPASVCASPVPNYAFVRAPSAAPLSPSLYALGGGDKTMTDLARLGLSAGPMPGSPNPLSPPISQRDRLFYAPAGGQEVVESSPTIDAVGGGGGGVHRHSRTQSNVGQAPAPSQPHAAMLRERAPHNAAGSHSHRRVASQPNDLTVPIAMPHALQQQQQAQTQQQPQHSAGLQIPAAAPHPGHTGGQGVDWMRVESRLHRLAEETDSEAHTHRRQSQLRQQQSQPATAALPPKSTASTPLPPEHSPASASVSVSVRALQQSHRAMPSTVGPVSVVRGEDTRRAPAAAAGGEPTAASS